MDVPVEQVVWLQRWWRRRKVRRRWTATLAALSKLSQVGARTRDPLARARAKLQHARAEMLRARDSVAGDDLSEEDLAWILEMQQASVFPTRDGACASRLSPGVGF